MARTSVTTGAQNDIERATDIARNMVTRWGLSDRMGPLAYGEDDGEVFLGRQVTRHKNVSDDTAHAIDEEIRTIINRNYERTEQILNENMDKLHAMADALIKYETIDADQIDDIMEGRTPREPQATGRRIKAPPSGGAQGRRSGQRRQKRRRRLDRRPGRAALGPSASINLVNSAPSFLRTNAAFF